MSDGDLRSWAETTVYPAGEGGEASPRDGDECPVCSEPLQEGERVHRVAAGDEQWVHDRHVWREGSGNGGG